MRVSLLVSRDLAFLCCVALLLLCTHYQTCLAESCKVRGVKKSECSKFEGISVFECGDTQNTQLSPSLINDDFCDCPNGADEPGTSACSLFSVPRSRISNVRSEEQNVFHQRGFWCRNQGYRGEYIYSSHVNDGICDCCDGSDEWKGHVDCPDRCAALAEESLKDLREKEVRFSAALRTRDQLQRTGEGIVNGKQQRKDTLDSMVNELQKKVDDLDAQKSQLQSKQDEWKEQRKNEERSKLEKEVAENPDLLKQNNDENDDQNNDGEDDEDDDEYGEMTESEARAKAERELDDELEKDEEYQQMSPRKQRKHRRQKRREIQRSIRERYRNHARKKVRQRRNQKRHRVSFDESKEEEKGKQESEQQQQQQKDDEGELDNEFPYSDEYRPPEDAGDENSDEEFPYPEEYRPKDEGSDVEENQDEESDVQFAEEEEYYGDSDDEEEYYDEGYGDDDSYDDGFKNEESSDQQFERILRQRTDEGLEVDQDYQAMKQDLENAKSEWRSAKDDLRDKRKELEELESFLSIGLSDGNSAWASLYGECFTAKVSKYTYEICPFQNAAQKEGSSSTSLGKFDAFQFENGRMRMKFDRGQSCWKGPKRSLTVTFECDSQSGFSSVSEPATCTYEASFSTPLACSHAELKEIRRLIENQFKEEL